MRVDFYQLSRDPVEKVIALLSAKVLQGGKRLLVVAGEEDDLTRAGKALWSAGPEQYLANGIAGGEYDARQPILLSDRCDPANGADIVILADGRWREEAARFDRALLLFGEDGTDAARDLWRNIGTRDDMERHIYKQDASGRWKEDAA